LETITGIIPHVLSFIINDLMKYGYRVAFEKDMSDLKGLVPADSLAPEDFELLELVDDEVVRVLLKSIDKVADCYRHFFIINNMDEFDVMEDTFYNEQATDNYNWYMIDWQNQDYKEVVQNLTMVYMNIYQLLFLTGYQISSDTVEIPENFHMEIHSFAHSSIADEVNFKDKNVSLLSDLELGLMKDLEEIERISEQAN
jgi:hypothetical protein